MLVNGAAFALRATARHGPRRTSDKAMGYERRSACRSTCVEASPGIAEVRCVCICAGWEAEMTAGAQPFCGGWAWLRCRVRAKRIEPKTGS